MLRMRPGSRRAPVVPGAPGLCFANWEGSGGGEDYPVEAMGCVGDFDGRACGGAVGGDLPGQG